MYSDIVVGRRMLVLQGGIVDHIHNELSQGYIHHLWVQDGLGGYGGIVDAGCLVGTGREGMHRSVTKYLQVILIQLLKEPRWDAVNTWRIPTFHAIEGSFHFPISW
jgi:hypothetical protein